MAIHYVQWIQRTFIHATYWEVVALLIGNGSARSIHSVVGAGNTVVYITLKLPGHALPAGQPCQKVNAFQHSQNSARRNITPLCQNRGLFERRAENSTYAPACQ